VLPLSSWLLWLDDLTSIAREYRPSIVKGEWLRALDQPFEYRAGIVG
jgi:hypothetical protein